MHSDNQEQLGETKDSKATTGVVVRIPHRAVTESKPVTETLEKEGREKRGKKDLYID